jgi:hypothetical protein
MAQLVERMAINYTFRGSNARGGVGNIFQSCEMCGSTTFPRFLRSGPARWVHRDQRPKTEDQRPIQLIQPIQPIQLGSSVPAGEACALEMR